MKKYIYLFFIFALFAPLETRAAELVNLPVPQLWEIPDGSWTPPWSGACEESSISMVDQFYVKTKNQSFSAVAAKKIMKPLFAIEDKLFGYNSDTNAVEIQKLIKYYTNYDATIESNPTLQEIKDELRAGRPVISLHYGYDLNNPLHRFRRGGSSYHVMVITGFDDSKGEFLVNDPELKNGIDFRYKYDIILSTLHDFNHNTKKADGVATALFTKPKQIVKAKGTNAIYVVWDNKKYYIASPQMFGVHRWSWSLVSEVEKAWLDSVALGGTIWK